MTKLRMKDSPASRAKTVRILVVEVLCFSRVAAVVVGGFTRLKYNETNSTSSRC